MLGFNVPKKSLQLPPFRLPPFSTKTTTVEDGPLVGDIKGPFLSSHQAK